MSWYVVVTNPNCHRRAESGLAELGYRAFWPKLRKWVSHSRIKVAKEYPILGRYLFVEVPDGNFFRVACVDGVEAILKGVDGDPAKVPDHVVWAFRERYMRGEWDFVSSETGMFWDHAQQKMMTRRNPLPSGARVRIMEGEFADLITTIRGRSRNGKLEFLPPGAHKFVATRASNVRAA